MYRRLLLVGDSQTQNGKWASRLNEEFVRRLDTTNRGLSGYNTAWSLAALPRLLPVTPMYHYDMATVWFGCNDAVLPGNKQHVPLPQFEKNLREIICRLLDIGIRPENILVLTPPTLNEEMLGVTYPGPAIRVNKVTEQYAAAALNTAADRGCKTSDLFKEFRELVEGGGQPFSDGLHLNEQGEAVVYRAVAEFVEQRLDGKLPIPDWKDL